MRIGARVRGKHDRKEVEAKKAEGVLPGQSRQANCARPVMRAAQPPRPASGPLAARAP